MDRELLTAHEVAELLGVSPRQVWRLAGERELGNGRFPRALKLSARIVRFHRDDLNSYLSHLRGQDAHG